MSMKNQPSAIELGAISPETNVVTKKLLGIFIATSLVVGGIAGGTITSAIAHHDAITSAIAHHDAVSSAPLFASTDEYITDSHGADEVFISVDLVPDRKRGGYTADVQASSYNTHFKDDVRGELLPKKSAISIPGHHFVITDEPSDEAGGNFAFAGKTFRVKFQAKRSDGTTTTVEHTFYFDTEDFSGTYHSGLIGE